MARKSTQPESDTKAVAQRKPAYGKVPDDVKLEVMDMYMRNYPIAQIALKLHISTATVSAIVRKMRDRYNEEYPELLDRMEKFLTDTYLKGIEVTSAALLNSDEPLSPHQAGYLMNQYAEGLTRLHALQKRSERKQIAMEQATSDLQNGPKPIRLVMRDFSEIPPETQKILINRGISTDKVIDAEYEKKD